MLNIRERAKDTPRLHTMRIRRYPDTAKIIDGNIERVPAGKILEHPYHGAGNAAPDHPGTSGKSCRDFL
jgi:hypothetical protein